ncbi:hypothetical protein LNP25_16750 [Klebsiella variicola subsp. variicola]|nr:hypothetical protein [Klebsiella variicola subsp. variicola]
MTQQSTRAGTVGAILRVTSGNFLEQFDFFPVCGFYATYIARTFFPAESEFAALMLTFAVFGSGFPDAPHRRGGPPAPISTESGAAKG